MHGALSRAHGRQRQAGTTLDRFRVNGLVTSVAFGGRRGRVCLPADRRAVRDRAGRPRPRRRLQQRLPGQAPGGGGLAVRFGDRARPVLGGHRLRAPPRAGLRVVHRRRRAGPVGLPRRHLRRGDLHPRPAPRARPQAPGRVPRDVPGDPPGRAAARRRLRPVPPGPAAARRRGPHAARRGHGRPAGRPGRHGRVPGRGRSAPCPCSATSPPCGRPRSPPGRPPPPGRPLTAICRECATTDPPASVK